MLRELINWGDGGSYTGNSPDPTHAYAFRQNWPDPTLTYNYNTPEYTLTASEGGQSVTYYNDVTVWPSWGEGSLSIGGNATGAEGQPITLGATFTDNDFAPSYYTNAHLYVDWGTSSAENVGSSNPTFGQYIETVVYPQPGTYTVVWSVSYEDSASPGGTWLEESQQVVVQHATPTVSVNGSGSAQVGEDYDVTPHFTAASGSHETAQQWTINWGDGQSTNYSATPGQPPHDYATPGAYTISATLITDEGTTLTPVEGTYVATNVVTVVGPTVGISDLYGAAHEGGADDYFIITRSFADSLPLNVSFTIGGDATSGEYELTDASGDILTNSVTIPANVTFADVIVTAVEDSTPAWTNTLDLTLDSSAAYTLSPTGSADTDIVNDDLSVRLSNGSGNLVLKGSAGGKSNIMPLYLNVPSGLEDGATVTLKEYGTTANRADVWTMPAPGATDQPILGNASGTLVTTKTWTVGTDLIPATLWVGAYSGSAAFGDVVFQLSDSDAGTTPPPAHPTQNTANSNAATAVYVQINMWNDPNGSGDWEKDIAGGTHNWLIGQVVDLDAVLIAPPAFTANVSFAWTVPGDVLRSIDEAGDSSHRTDVQLTADTGYTEAGGGHLGKTDSGTARQEVIFFWESTTADSGSDDTDTVSVTASFASRTCQASTTFDVYTPIYYATATAGAVNIALYGTPKVLSVGLLPAGGQGGINWFTTVSSETGFAPGLFRYLQVVKTVRTYTTSLGGSQHSLWPSGTDYSSNWVLDSEDPYDGYDIFKQIDPYDGGLGWNTDTGRRHTNNDSPNQDLSLEKSDATVTLNDSFETYVMYLPPGLNNFWVPLAVEPWSYTITAIQARPGFWVQAAVSQTVPTGNFEPVATEPQWTVKAVGSEG